MDPNNYPWSFFIEKHSELSLGTVKHLLTNKERPIQVARDIVHHEIKVKIVLGCFLFGQLLSL